eukprot:1147064-Pelagomonas_calceolata.AAC.2
MSLLAAVEQALLRRHAPPPPPTHSPAPGVDASNASSSRRKPKSAVQELEELRKAPGSSPSQQLQSLRGHFESCITQPSRYVEEQQLSRWMQGEHEGLGKQEERRLDSRVHVSASVHAQQTSEGLRDADLSCSASARFD